MKKSIPVKCGIYSTEYRLICHKDGSFSVKIPFVKWVGNTGKLSFEVVTVPENRKSTILKMFENQELLNDYGNLTIEDCLYGY